MTGELLKQAQEHKSTKEPEVMTTEESLQRRCEQYEIQVELLKKGGRKQQRRIKDLEEMIQVLDEQIRHLAEPSNRRATSGSVNPSRKSVWSKIRLGMGLSSVRRKNPVEDTEINSKTDYQYNSEPTLLMSDILFAVQYPSM